MSASPERPRDKTSIKEMTLKDNKSSSVLIQFRLTVTHRVQTSGFVNLTHLLQSEYSSRRLSK